MSGDCTSCSGTPKALLQSDLVNTSVGQAKYSGGCGRYFNIMGDCRNAGFDWPQNGEYSPVNYVNQSSSCVVCTSSPGCDCSCLGGQQTGYSCGIVRNEFKGHTGSCALKFASSAKSDYQLTGIQTSDDPTTMWSNFDKKTFTCPPLRPYDPSVVKGVMDLCVNQPYNILQDKWKQGGECWNWVIQGSGNQNITAPVLSGALSRFSELYGGVDLSSYNSENSSSISYLNGVLSACHSNPSACEPYLNGLCKKHSIKDPRPLTRGDITKASSNSVGNVNNKNIVSACACHLPADQYATHAKIGIDENSTSSCDPLCKLPGAIPKQICSGGNCRPSVCQQNICVIDNVSVGITGSQVGNVDFSILCGGCDTKSGGCLCLFENSNVIAQSSKVGGVNFSMNCGGNCAIVDPKTGKQTKIQCPGKSDVGSLLSDYSVEIGFGVVIAGLLAVTAFSSE